MILLLLTAFCLTAVSCSVLEPAIPSASFIHIDSISLYTDYLTQGSKSEKITDVWVVYDDEYLGTYPLPADIPLLGTGNHNITVRAGIIENGIASLRSAYPKYSSFDTLINLAANQKASFSPSVTYSPGIFFPQIEDFDDASLSLVSTNLDYAPLEITQPNDPNTFEGNSGIAVLDFDHPVFDVATSTPFPLSIYTPTYLELNYKGDNDFSIGIFISTQGGVVYSNLVTVKASQEWKKIYVSISDLGGVQTSGIDYKISLHAEKRPDQISGNLYFDNLKVVN